MEELLTYSRTSLCNCKTSICFSDSVPLSQISVSCDCILTGDNYFAEGIYTDSPWPSHWFGLCAMSQTVLTSITYLKGLHLGCIGFSSWGHKSCKEAPDGSFRVCIYTSTSLCSIHTVRCDWPQITLSVHRYTHWQKMLGFTPPGSSHNLLVSRNNIILCTSMITRVESKPVSSDFNFCGKFASLCLRALALMVSASRNSWAFNRFVS